MKPEGNYTTEARAPFLRFKCVRCGAAPRNPCKSTAGVESLPHKARVQRARSAKA